MSSLLSHNYHPKHHSDQAEEDRNDQTRQRKLSSSFEWGRKKACKDTISECLQRKQNFKIKKRKHRFTWFLCWVLWFFLWSHPVDEFVSYFGFEEMLHSITCSPSSEWVPSEWESDKNITIIHTTPVHQLTSWERKNSMFVKYKSIF